MDNTILYRESSLDIRNKIKYYKKLNINGVLISPFDYIDDEIINEVLSINDTLKDNDIRLFVEIDIVETIKTLLDTSSSIDIRNPKIRNAFYQFINYLIKFGISGFYFTGLNDLKERCNSAEEFLALIRELAKNTVARDGVSGMVEIDDQPRDLLNYLSNPSLNNFDYININYNEAIDFTQYKNLLQIHQTKNSETNINTILTTKSPLEKYLNYQNFPNYSQTLLAGAIFLLRGIPLIEDDEEMGMNRPNSSRTDINLLNLTTDVSDFYKQILNIRLKYKSINKGNFRMIFPKDRDILAYMRTFEDEKAIVFANFSQREVMADIRFHFIDLYDYKYLIGNYGRRRIVKNLLLRPYEFVVFIKNQTL